MANFLCCGLLLVFINTPSSKSEDLPCGLEYLHDNFDIVNCDTDGVVNARDFVPHGSICAIRCKSQKSDDNKWKRCYHGNWKGPIISCDESLKTLKMQPRATGSPLERKKRGFWRSLVCWVFGCRQGRADNRPPTLTCPGDITAYNRDLQTHAYFTWPEPEAHDNRDGRVRTERNGPAPGQLLSSNYTVRYVARDRAGNIATCSFRVILIVIRCPPPQKIVNGFYRCHPNTDFVKGGRCTFGCYHGYKLKGPRAVVCQNNWRWSDGFPQCEKTRCPVLMPPPHASLVCTDGFNYLSACTFTCLTPGYGIPAGTRRVQVCQADSTWSGKTPSCLDLAPPTFTNCPHSVKATADRGTSTALVSWAEPRVVDNSGETISAIQIKGHSSGSRFTSGYHNIEYKAVDSAGNRATPCRFKVIVRELNCHALYATPYQTITCPDGYRYGSECKFECDPDFALTGSSRTTCDITGVPPYGVWTFPKQPACEVAIPCPKLRVPVNGALVCDEWYKGSFCQLQCQNGTDISPTLKPWELFICGDSGLWNIKENLHNEIPDCIAISQGAQLRYRMATRFYYNGDCSDPDVQKQIQTNFIGLIENQPACLSALSQCSIDNVKVTCGKRRQRRELGDVAHTADDRVREKREAVDTTIDIEFQFSYNSQSTDQSAINTWKSRVYSVTNEVVESGNVSVNGIPLYGGSIASSDIDVECENGSVINHKYLACMKCPLGTFHNITSKNCDPCPKGHYQDLEGQVTCKACVDGQTTTSKGSDSSDQCRDSCPEGTFSKKGVAPCSPCPVGFYQPRSGQSQCTICPGVRTTVNQGATHVDMCHDFDIVFYPNETATAFAVIDVEVNDTSSVIISTWLQCTKDCQNTHLVTLDVHDTERWLILEGRENLTLTINSTEHKGIGFLVPHKWHFLEIQLLQLQSFKSVVIWMDGVNSASVNLTDHSFINIQKLTLGGPNFTGRYSQLQIRNSTVVSTPSDRKCSNGTGGDVFAWNRFTAAILQQSYIDIPSLCDDVDECETNPCYNGKCYDKLRAFSCQCDLGWSGDLCDVNIDDCIDNICENNGTCVDDVNNFHCACSDTFKGKYCEIQIVNGQWGAWSNWTTCDVACGQGSHSRTRMCDSPYPNNGGRDCEGETTEVKSCDMPACIECTSLDDPINGLTDCNTTAEEITCNLLCENGHVFDMEPLEQYTCSRDTLNVWNIQTELNPLKRLPNCQRVIPAQKLGIIFKVSYKTTSNQSCESAPELESKLTNITTPEIVCGGSRKCNITEIKVKPCEGRSKRDASSDLDLSIVIMVDSGDEKASEVLEAANMNLEQRAKAREFDISLGDVNYITDVNSTSVEPLIKCEDGHTTYSYFCVPCGPGTFYKDGQCEWCDVGTYQGNDAQTSCISCPPDWTTLGVGSREVGDCIVPLPSTSTTTTENTAKVTTTVKGADSGTDVKPHQGSRKLLIIGFSTSLPLVAIVVVIFGAVVCKRRRSSRRAN